MFKNFYDNHPIKFSVITSLIASVIYSLFVEPLIYKIQALSFLKLTLVFPFPEEKPFSFNISIIGIVFVLTVIGFISAYVAKGITKKKVLKNIIENLPHDDFCGSCERTSDLADKITKQQKKYETLMLDYQKALPYKNLTDPLKKYFAKSEVLESIQLFSVPELPSLEKANSLTKIEIPLHFVDGMAKETSNTNALFNINYTLDKSTYHDVKKLFDMRNQYYDRKDSQRNPEVENDIQREAVRVFEMIKDHLNSISSKNDIKDYHYVYYKLLDILANIVIGKGIQYSNLLDAPDIEEQLRYGQRTGMLGAIFTEQLYCFYNENSMTKKDRLYFSVPILYKKKRLILLGICNKNNLRIEKNHTCMDCCEQIYDEIRKALAKSGGEAA